MMYVMVRDAQAYCRTVSVHPSVHLSICVSVRDSLSHAYVPSIARREPRRLPACDFVFDYRADPLAAGSDT